MCTTLCQYTDCRPSVTKIWSHQKCFMKGCFPRALFEQTTHCLLDRFCVSESMRVGGRGNTMDSLPLEFGTEGFGLVCHCQGNNRDTIIRKRALMSKVLGAKFGKFKFFDSKHGEVENTANFFQFDRFSKFVWTNTCWRRKFGFFSNLYSQFVKWFLPFFWLVWCHQTTNAWACCEICKNAFCSLELTKKQDCLSTVRWRILFLN